MKLIVITDRDSYESLIYKNLFDFKSKKFVEISKINPGNIYNFTEFTQTVSFNEFTYSIELRKREIHSDTIAAYTTVTAVNLLNGKTREEYPIDSDIYKYWYRYIGKAIEQTEKLEKTLKKEQLYLEYLESNLFLISKIRRKEKFRNKRKKSCLYSISKILTNSNVQK